MNSGRAHTVVGAHTLMKKRQVVALQKQRLHILHSHVIPAGIPVWQGLQLLAEQQERLRNYDAGINWAASLTLP